MMVNPNECSGCGHDLRSDDASKGHFEKQTAAGPMLICKECQEICRTPTPAVVQPPPPAPSVTAKPPENVEQLAQAVAEKMARMKAEYFWKDLQRPGCVIRAVDGGWIVMNRTGDEAVRLGLDEALQKAKEWLSPPA